MPFYRLSIFLPYAVPGVVAVMIWGYMYGSQFNYAAAIAIVSGVITMVVAYLVQLAGEKNEAKS